MSCGQRGAGVALSHIGSPSNTLLRWLARHQRPGRALASLHFRRQGRLILLTTMGSKNVGNNALEVSLDGRKRRSGICCRGDCPCQRLDLGRDRLIEGGLRGIPRQEQIIDGLAHFDDKVYPQFLSHDEPPGVKVRRLRSAVWQPDGAPRTIPRSLLCAVGFARQRAGSPVFNLTALREAEEASWPRSRESQPRARLAAANPRRAATCDRGVE